ncbi:MAG: Rrf2 family transcriptional regulator [candidate division Zixibacteria bacterium]|nr:Rrf2 family transcriptional regulator [candidate division Zixibacteria bacterium]
MRISATEEYCLRCLLVLARQGPDKQLSIGDIAAREGISVPYTSKLLSLLRKTDMVKAVRGRKGGFCITREPEKIDLLEVITGLGGPLIDPDHCLKRTGQLERCIHGTNCSVHNLLGGIAGYVETYLSNISLKDIINNDIPQAADLPETTSRIVTFKIRNGIPNRKAKGTKLKTSKY